MNDSFFMSGLEGSGNLQAEPQRLMDWQRSMLQALFQRLAIDEFEHEKPAGVRFLETINRSNIRMVQRGKRFGFALKTREPVGIRPQMLQEEI